MVAVLDGPELVVAHIEQCTDADAAVVVDGSADEVIDRLLAAGWTLEDRTDFVAGKRIRFLVPPAEAPQRLVQVGRDTVDLAQEADEAEAIADAEDQDGADGR